jgi:hypothetical protein
LVVGNIPPERQQEYRKYMVEIDINDSPSSINATLHWWLEHEVICMVISNY